MENKSLEQTPEQLRQSRDPKLWRTAQKRASFRYHALIYFVMIIFFWTMYYISLRSSDTPVFQRSSIPWPVWPMAGWGIALIFHYLGAYGNTNKRAETEYEKLKNKQNQNK